MNLPNHIVIVPDGNRRWAEKRSFLLGKKLPLFFGHREGAKAAEKILRAVLGLKIPYFTFWGCSVNNIAKRPKPEVNFLFKLFGTYFKKLANDKDVHKNKVRINVLGRWENLFPEMAKKTIRQAVEKTKNYRKHRLTFLLAYSGTDEMTTAIKKISDLRSNGKDLRIDEKLIKANLWTKDLPAVDLVIRTGGEPHWSDGLMMWDVANAQLYFTDALWPDFSVEELKKAIMDYSKIQRRFGR